MAPPAFPAAGPTVTAHPNRAGVVLLVEDEALMRLAVAKVLRKNSIPVMEAADGTAALTLIREHSHRIAVVLLDITLPGAPSSIVFAEARRLSPDVKVILTSAYGRMKADEFFPGMEIDAFIRKPYQLADLVSLVRTFLSKHREMIAS
jgi:two-component system cell cycle sensor histidine kinase/response regulator CckA